MTGSYQPVKAPEPHTVRHLFREQMKLHVKIVWKLFVENGNKCLQIVFVALLVPTAGVTFSNKGGQASISNFNGIVIIFPTFSNSVRKVVFLYISEQVYQNI